MTNPKALMAWLAIITLGLKPGPPVFVTIFIVIGCTALGAVVFNGYVILFSTKKMIKIYSDFKQWIEGILSTVFGVAGIGMLYSALDSE